MRTFSAVVLLSIALYGVLNGVKTSSVTEIIDTFVLLVTLNSFHCLSEALVVEVDRLFLISHLV